MSDVIPGIFAKAYILSTGARATWGTLNATTGCNEGAAPTGLAEIKVVRTIDLNLDDSEGDASSRKSKFKLSIPTLMEASIDIEIPWNPTDANFIKIRNAKFTRGTVPIVFLDQDKATAGAQGIWADWHVFGWKKSEPLDKEQVLKITLKPGPTAVEPEYVSVTSGS